MNDMDWFRKALRSRRKTGCMVLLLPAMAAFFAGSFYILEVWV